jgi:hypothetical protein
MVQPIAGGARNSGGGGNTPEACKSNFTRQRRAASVPNNKNGGGGGNRTRVRKCVHVRFYVRSLSFGLVAFQERLRQAFLDRQAGTYSAGRPAIASARDLLICRPGPLAGGHGQDALHYIRQRGRSYRSQLTLIGFLRGQPINLGTQHTLHPPPSTPEKRP